MKNTDRGVPTNFSWLEPSKVAGTSVPRSVAEMAAMVREGVAHLVSLSPDTPPPTFPLKGLTIHCIHVKEFEAPSIDQIDEFLHICEVAKAAGEGVAVHCRGGNGRTGTMLAVYLVWSRGMEARAAVKEVRRTRPGSIENKKQENVVSDFMNYKKSLMLDLNV